MLSFVLFCLSGLSQTNDFSAFHAALIKEGFSVSFLPDNILPREDSLPQNDSFLQNSRLDSQSVSSADLKFSLKSAVQNKSEQFILLTDSTEAAFCAKDLNIACIGIAESTRWDSFPFSCRLWESFESASVASLCMFHAHFHHYPADILKTPRLLVREFSLSDAHSLYLLKTQPLTMRFIDETVADESAETEKLSAYIQNAYPFYELALWGLFEKDSGRFIGRAGFMPVEEEDFFRLGFNFSVGYMIDEHCCGLGYASEVLPALLSFAKELGHTHILCQIKKENTASLHVLSHCGFPYQILSHKKEVITFGISL